MAKEIHLTPDGGHFYKAMAYHWSITIAVLPFVLVLILAAILNPLWFRNDFFNYIERKIHQFGSWRNKVKYRIYLGTDPDVWHALKD